MDLKQVKYLSDCDLPECSEENYAENFESLIKPLSSVAENSHFSFESESSWQNDISCFSNYFSIDLKDLSDAIDCIPFNECINIPDKYFTPDQLTDIQNKAEARKDEYNTKLEIEIHDKCASKSYLESEDISDIIEEEKDDNFQISESYNTNPINTMLFKDLKFSKVSNKSSDTSKTVINIGSKDSKVPATSLSAKSFDIDQWLDKILED